MRAARAGIFVKNPDALERLRHVDTVLLDKTGTLTEGRATVARWHGEDAALQFARALEAESAHAVARAFQDELAFGDAVATIPGSARCRTVEQVVEVPGQGIAGRLDGHDVRVGNRAHVEAGGAVVPTTRRGGRGDDLRTASARCSSRVDGQVRGVAGIGDRLRGDAPRTVAALRAPRRSRPDPLRRSPGDRRARGARTGAAGRGRAWRPHPGRQAGHRRPDAGRRGGADRRRGSVVMVGDGVNDAAALALADVGIAVHGGTGATIVASDIVLTREGVAPLVEILDGARRLRGVIRRNLVFSLLYNAGAAALRDGRPRRAARRGGPDAALVADRGAVVDAHARRSRHAAWRGRSVGRHGTTRPADGGQAREGGGLTWRRSSSCSRSRC